MIGEPVELSSLAVITVLSATDWSTAVQVPQAGFRFVDVELTVTALNTELPLGGDSFAIVDATRKRYAPTDGAVPALTLPATLANGETATGHLTFQVPIGTSYELWFQLGAASAAAVSLTTVTAMATPMPTATPIYVEPTPVPMPTLVATAKLVALPKLSEKISGATAIKYYAIKGDSPNDLHKQMGRYGDDHCSDNDAIACVHISYRPRVISSFQDPYSGSCKITDVRIEARYVVWLPRWTKPSHVYPELLAWWRKVLDHIAWHEGQHIKIARSRFPALRDKLEGASCAKADSIVNAFDARLDDAQDAFDAKDRSWSSPTYSGPGGWFGTTP
jgi:predicted secreted Zn-dependent protease